MEFLFKYFWVMFIVVTFMNGYYIKFNSKKYIKENPELKEDYGKIFKTFITYGNIPWVVMGIGILINFTNNICDYLNPRSGNPVVLLFHLSIIFIWIQSVRWIYFKNGAEFLERHPGVFRKRGFSGDTDKLSAFQIKLFVALCLLGGLAGEIMMWVMDIPTPTFH